MKRDLGRLAEGGCELLVVGGGIYGAMVAWDAAQRGLRTALVEAGDFGGGTSWNSLKTVHGGLRHLQRAELGRLRESVRERRALLRIAPALVRPLKFLVPTYGHGPRGREALLLGVFLSERLSWGRNRGLSPTDRLAPMRAHSREAVLERLPGLPRAGLNGAVEWQDAQLVSSERLLMAVLHAAAGAGAQLANRAALARLRRERDRLVATLRDGVTGADLELAPGVVVNAAGPAAEAIWSLAGARGPRVPLLRAVNLVLRRPLPIEAAVGARLDGRFLFLVPWRGSTLAGTAYADLSVTGEELARRFLRDLERAFPWAEPRPADVALVHEGRVPGDARALWSRSLLVDHAAGGAPGLISALGAKYTTARAVAEKAVDRAFRHLGRTPPPCRTAVTPLEGARLPEGDLAEQARRAVREEMALDLEDVVLRRLELGAAGRPEPEALAAVAGVVAGELGWDAAQIAAARSALDARWTPPGGLPPA